MKRILTITAAIMLSMAAVAQDGEDPPSFWLGGEITFGSFSSWDLTIGPSFGLLINENLGAGASVLFGLGDNAIAYGFEPYARYYMPVVDNFSLYGDGYLGISGGDTQRDLTDIGEYFSFYAGARVGIQYWFTQTWSMAASTRIFEFSVTDGDTSLGVGVNFNVLEFSFYFHF
jgi:hypothetical protein